MSKPQNNYAFIDSQNLNLGIQKMGWKLDWRKFREFLEKEYGVTKAFMFIGYMQENEFLYEQMHDLGYLIVLKPTVESVVEGAPEEAGKPPSETPEKKTVKGNTDADMVLYTLKEMPNYDKAVLVSGDGDFYSLVEYLRDQQRLLYVMAPNWQYSTLLKDFEEYVVRLDLLRKKLEYRYKRKNKSNKQ